MAWHGIPLVPQLQGNATCTQSWGEIGVAQASRSPKGALLRAELSI